MSSRNQGVKHTSLEDSVRYRKSYNKPMDSCPSDLYTSSFACYSISIPKASQTLTSLVILIMERDIQYSGIDVKCDTNFSKHLITAQLVDQGTQPFTKPAFMCSSYTSNTPDGWLRHRFHSLSYRSWVLLKTLSTFCPRPILQ